MSGDDEGPYSGPTIVTTLEGGRFTVWPGCRYILILTATRALLNTTFKGSVHSPGIMINMHKYLFKKMTQACIKNSEILTPILIDLIR